MCETRKQSAHPGAPEQGGTSGGGGVAAVAAPSSPPAKKAARIGNCLSKLGRSRDALPLTRAVGCRCARQHAPTVARSFQSAERPIRRKPPLYEKSPGRPSAIPTLTQAHRDVGPRSPLTDPPQLQYLVQCFPDEAAGGSEAIASQMSRKTTSRVAVAFWRKGDIDIGGRPPHTIAALLVLR
jgi:hypothetical protein